MHQLAGRVAVVTGAARGIGFAISEVLLAKGCEVALVDFDSPALGRAAEALGRDSGRLSTHVVDVSNRSQMQALPGQVIEAHGRVHILVNNAGVSVVGTLQEQSLEDLEWIIGVNLWGVLYGCKFFLPYLGAEDEGHIVNLSSLFGLIGVPTQTSYSLTKFAVRGLSEALRAELVATTVDLSVVYPGAIETNIIQASRIASGERRAKLQKRLARFAISPDRAAEQIVRAIELNRPTVRIGRGTHLIDWAKRLFPDLVQHAIARGYRRQTPAD